MMTSNRCLLSTWKAE